MRGSAAPKAPPPPPSATPSELIFVDANDHQRLVTDNAPGTTGMDVEGEENIDEESNLFHPGKIDMRTATPVTDSNQADAAFERLADARERTAHSSWGGVALAGSGNHDAWAVASRTAKLACNGLVRKCT